MNSTAQKDIVTIMELKNKTVFSKLVCLQRYLKPDSPPAYISVNQK